MPNLLPLEASALLLYAVNPNRLSRAFIKALVIGLVMTYCGTIFGQAAASGHTTNKARSSVKTTSPALKDELDVLYTTAHGYTAHFSKIVCQEAIHSEQNSTSSNGMFARPVHWKMDTKAEYTAAKSPKGVAGFEESRVYFQQDGKPVADPKKKIVHPYLLADAFAPAILSYFAPDHRVCLSFTKTEGRINFKTLPGKGGHGECADIAPQAHGYVLFDQATQTISHFERTVPLEAGRAGGFAPFAGIDYAAYGYHGHLYMLPARVMATKTDGSIKYDFDATYSDCKLFGAVVTIRDAKGNVILSPPD